MFVPFESLPPGARVWVFQASRPLTDPEIQVAHERLRAFTESWVVHGSPLDSSYSIRHRQFIVLAADESSQRASGCSIDSSVRVLKELQALLGVDLFDRNQIAFLEGDKVRLVPLKELKQKFDDGILSGDTLTFNNIVDTREALETAWLVPASETWLKRYLSNALAKEE